MLGFKDFAPPSLNNTPDVQPGTYANIQEAVDAANRWIQANGINVVTVETVVVPVAAPAYPADLVDDDAPTPPPVAPAGPGAWHQFVRCWFRV